MKKRKYLFDIEKIDYDFLNDLKAIEFTFYVQHPLIRDILMMDIDSVLKLKKTIDEMLELRKKKIKLKKEREERNKLIKENYKATRGEEY